MTDRHQFRARFHDYNDGVYFVTVCCKNKLHMLGHITNGEIVLSQCGIELQQWLERLKTTSKFRIINEVIMPNHFHLLVGTRFCASPLANATQTRTNHNPGCLKPPKYGDPVEDLHHNSALAVFMGNLKGGITRFARKNGIQFEWQQRFHEHIVRSQRAFDNIMYYIDNNIANWDTDCFNTTK